MGSCTNWCGKKQLSLDDYRDWGFKPIYGMVYLPAYLHLCESAEALGSGVACYRLSRT